MFESFGRGLKMIGASIKMGWHDKRLLLPSILTVFTNIVFAIILLFVGLQDMTHGHAGDAAKQLSHMSPGQLSGGVGHGFLASNPGQGMPNLLGGGAMPGSPAGLTGMGGVNSPMDQSGFKAMSGIFTEENVLVICLIMMVWWTCNRFLEGVTTALVYSHLAEGARSGRFSKAAAAVFQSLPAILILGLVTLLCKRMAGWMRKKKNAAGMFGFGFKFLASIVEVFWTLAGHLILPAIVIEGTSFWGGLKRADKIARGNLLTIGVGEVGVDVICRITTALLYAAGVAGFGAVYYMAYEMKMAVSPALVWSGGLFWAGLVVVVTALSIYIRAAFYTCLYVWAIDAEAVKVTERKKVRAPEPLAAALA
jgi:hypothetical protein